MSDLLVKRLRDAAKMSEALAVLLPHSKGNATAKLYNEAADAIEELSKPRWIPVAERLPGTGEIVLVYGKRGGIYTAEHNRSARWPGSFWKLNSKSHYCEPTHWMPLPEPPKEE